MNGKFAKCSNFVIETNRSYGVEILNKEKRTNQTKKQVIHEIGLFVLKHCIGEIKILNDVDRIYIYAREKENPDETYRLIIQSEKE